MSALDLKTARWRKSSRSTNQANCVEVAHIDAPAQWRKSSRSTNTGNCVELAHGSTVAGIRDSKNVSGPVLLLPATALESLLTAVR
ncbi:DUF397 domain-containing protein [Actinokineospora sp. NBRC 105648]|uniref:DUF397 domain-containing protein n=1 Tax=Actinokineospora sp. NBRC 105648 TaxID=3032206 RepID=UPI0024A206EF|nr:DUF397 domain-containing protein [Actinokineospora sp. NBRC 105648]GLZ41230.1 hypothetical protein Acsp05_48540 [Actinokineospora sp. NBRC 105648]